MSAQEEPAGLVIGASSGVGLHLVRLLCERGPVIAASRRGGAGEGTEVRCDVRDHASVEALFRSIPPGGLAWVVNCAGVGYYAPLTADHAAEWEDIVRTNLLGLVHVASALLRFHPRCPCFVHVGSMASRRLSPTPGNGVYSATKAAAVPILDHLRNELRAAGHTMRVSLVTPGFIRDTAFAENFFRHAPERAFDLFSAGACSLTPAAVARAVAGVLDTADGEVLELVLAPPSGAPA